MFKRFLFMLVGLAVVLVLLLSINILGGASLRSTRLDLTENKLYTLSEGTKAVLSKVEEPITLRLYYSKTLAQEVPTLPGYARRVEELLLEYVHHSNGKLTLEQYDPEPFTETEDRAVQYGLQGAPLPGGDTLYFGLAASNTIGDEEIVPFFQPSPQKEAFLEYDLTMLIHRLSNPEKLVIGVMSSLPIEGAAAANPFMQQDLPEPWFVMDQLRQQHETQTVMTTVTEIPAEVGVLLVVHPKELGDATLYAIDQFVMRGGKVIAFVDPYCEADIPPQDPQNPMAAMMAPRASTLGPLFDAWGVELVGETLAGDRQNALSVTFENRGREEPVPYVLWFGLGAESFNEGEVASRDLKEVRFGTAGILRPREGASTDFAPLIQSSTESMEIAVNRIQFAPNPPELLADFFPTKTPFTLAARVSGPSKSAFPDGRPVPADETALEDPAEHVAEAASIQVVVVSDADMLADRWWVRVQNFGGMRLGMKTADNGDFLTNVLDVMQGSTDMISLRGRGGSTYPFEVVEEITRVAEQQYRAEEQRLVDVLESGQRRLNELQSKKEGDSLLMLSPEQEAEIERLIDEQVATRTTLRDVRRGLRKDVESLGAKLKWLNMGAVPGLVLLFALCMVVYNVNRRKVA
jgi:ABC-type uncharacterized transport system involved in gliding motility auxiliary subunit